MSRKSLGHSVVYNLVGILVPLFVTLFTVPLYLRAIGEARFGIMSLIWLLFGYFGLFDFGLSRATANRLAQLRMSDSRERSMVFYTAVFMNTVLGILAAVAFYFAALPLLSYIAGGTTELATEVPPALPWIAMFFPLAMIGGVFVGSLEAEERFLAINLQQIVGTLLLQGFPLFAVWIFGPRISVAVFGAIAARLLSVVWLGIAAVPMMVAGGRPSIDLEHGRLLLRYGGWVAVTNAIGPLLVSADQFLIASLLGASAVVYYSVPFGLAMKALVFPGALTRALFPRLSRLHGEAATDLADRASSCLAGLMALICAPAIVLANVGLTLWVGQPFALAATPVAQALLVGAWMNGVAFVPFALLQGRGRPDIVAKFHLYELIPYVALLWVCLKEFGLPGAAFAWVFRVAIDTSLLYWATGDLSMRLRPLYVPGLVVMVTFICVKCLSLTLLGSLLLASAIGLGIFLFIVLLDPILRDYMMRNLRWVS